MTLHTTILLLYEDVSVMVTPYQISLPFPLPDDPSSDAMKKIISLPKANVRSNINVKVGDMFEETRQILYDLYKPFNEELAHMFGDKRLNYEIR